MKTYSTPQLTEFGGVADLTRAIGGMELNDVYLLATGEVLTGNEGAVPSDFGCEDVSPRDGICDADAL